jgi:hypothetical protein
VSRSARIIALLMAASGCGGPQARDETAITYRAGFKAEAGASTKVFFPFPVDAAASEVSEGLSVTDGGTASVLSDGGTWLVVSGRGEIEASYRATKSKAFGEESIPSAQLSGEVPDAGPDVRYVTVNKGGTASAQIQFEYTASKDCGGGCGGKRSWTFQGQVGLSRQEVQMTFVEEKN